METTALTVPCLADWATDWQNDQLADRQAYWLIGLIRWYTPVIGLLGWFSSWLNKKLHSDRLTFESLLLSRHLFPAASWCFSMFQARWLTNHSNHLPGCLALCMPGGAGIFLTEWMDEWRLNGWLNENKSQLLCSPKYMALSLGPLLVASELCCLQTDSGDWHLAVWVTFFLVLMAIIQPNSRMFLAWLYWPTCWLADLGEMSQYSELAVSLDDCLPARLAGCLLTTVTECWPGLSWFFWFQGESDSSWTHSPLEACRQRLWTWTWELWTIHLQTIVFNLLSLMCWSWRRSQMCWHVISTHSPPMVGSWQFLIYFPSV